MPSNIPAAMQCDHNLMDIEFRIIILRIEEREREEKFVHCTFPIGLFSLNIENKLRILVLNFNVQDLNLFTHVDLYDFSKFYRRASKHFFVT